MGRRRRSEAAAGAAAGRAADGRAMAPPMLLLVRCAELLLLLVLHDLAVDWVSAAADIARGCVCLFWGRAREWVARERKERVAHCCGGRARGAHFAIASLAHRSIRDRSESFEKNAKR